MIRRIHGIHGIHAFALGLLMSVAACGRHSQTADTTLSHDLSLAAQQHAPFDSLSSSERSPNATPATGASRMASRSSGSTSTSAVPRTRRASGTRTASAGGTTASAPSSSGTVVKHTKRDAAIGAAAGAVIGATTSRNKVKGGVIGAAIGGILGGVIGNNVDKKKVP
jgi:YmgG-like glycine-zipper protein